MNKLIHSKYKLPIAITVLAIISRMLPHSYNFTPFGAMALFGAAYYNDKKLALIFPVLAAWISGVILNNTVYSSIHPNFILFDKDILWQSLSYIGIVFLGFNLLKSKVSVSRVLTGAVASSVIFFLLTNFGFWTSGLIYPMNAGGLAACFTAAIPFYKSTLLGDLIYSSLFFGSYYFIAGRSLVLKHVE